MTRLLSFLLVLLLLASCDDEDNPADPGEVSESEFVTHLYEGPKWPEDVTVDPAVGDVTYLGFNTASGRTLPCVRTVAEAESLAVEAGFSIVGEARESDLYFEFDNARVEYGRPIVRVYRSSYLEALTFVALYSFGWPGGGIGVIGPVTYRPLTAAVVLDLLDHIWVQRNYSLSGAALVRRQVDDHEAAIVLTIHEALIVGGDFGVCDGIHQLITTYTVDKVTGAVAITRFVLPEMKGRCH